MRLAVATTLLALYCTLQHANPLKLPAPTHQIIITKSAISSGVTPSSLPPNLLVHSLDEPYSHVHLIVENKKKKFTQRQLDELSLELAVTLDDTIPNDKSVLITASNIDPNNKPIDPKSIIKKARTKHLKTHSLDTPMNTLPWPSSSPFSLSACKIVGTKSSRNSSPRCSCYNYVRNSSP